jgi:quercetin dioxygenase-like cupin family protein
VPGSIVYASTTRTKGQDMTDIAQQQDTAAARPVALGANEGEAYWFFGTLVTIKAGSEETSGGAVITENLAPRGSGSPLHVHRREDEWFYVLEGELTFWVGGELIVAGLGGFVYGPRDIPHTFIVSSEQARFLLVTEPGAFDGFVRALGQPAERLEIPDGAGAPPDMGVLVDTPRSTAWRSSGRPGSPPDAARAGRAAARRSSRGPGPSLPLSVIHGRHRGLRRCRA